MHLKTIFPYVYMSIHMLDYCCSPAGDSLSLPSKNEKQDLPYPEARISSQPHTPHPNWPPANNNDPECIYRYIYIFKYIYIYIQVVYTVHEKKYIMFFEIMGAICMCAGVSG